MPVAPVRPIVAIQAWVGVAVAVAVNGSATIPTTTPTTAISASSHRRDAHCNDSSEHVVSGQCTITSGNGTLQNVGVNDERDSWTCVWGQTVKATARALCSK